MKELWDDLFAAQITGSEELTGMRKSEAVTPYCTHGSDSAATLERQHNSVAASASDYFWAIMLKHKPV
jgi:hypothetical protein